MPMKEEGKEQQQRGPQVVVEGAHQACGCGDHDPGQPPVMFRLVVMWSFPALEGPARWKYELEYLAGRAAMGEPRWEIVEGELVDCALEWLCEELHRAKRQETERLLRGQGAPPEGRP